MKRRPQAEFEAVMALMEVGRSDREIAKLTGAPHGTINAWRRGLGLRQRRRVAMATPAWRPKAPGPYCYLLGVYLGDGHIHVTPRGAASLMITLDAAYPGIVEEVRCALASVFPDTRVSRFQRGRGSVAALQICHPVLPFAFPQHGAGRKHLRTIALTPWQRELTLTHPRELLRGLIHSDGCRTVNRFKTRLPSGRVAGYEYPRYFFSNLSADIRRIFCQHCELLGIRWTQSNARNISISHRRSVAIMDEFIGSKR